MTANQALVHPFIMEAHGTEVPKLLTHSSNRLRHFHAAGKLKAAQNSIMAVNMLKKGHLTVLNNLRSSQSNVAKSVSQTIKKN